MTQLNTASLTWKISDLNTSNLKPSPEFGFGTNQSKFWLRFYPREVFKDMNNHLAIYLLRTTPHTTDKKVLWTISLISDKGQECYPLDIETKFTAKSEFFPSAGGWYQLNRDNILGSSSGLLSDGKLTVKCTVTNLDQQGSFNFAKPSIEDKAIILVQKKALSNYQPHLEKSKFSDVVFVIGMKEFKLHKIILSSQSPVFAAMFDSDLEETKQNRVEITDVDVKVFEALIRFMYTANVDSVQQYAHDLFVAADKYQLDTLKDICAHSLGSNLTIDSVAKILLVADMHSSQELKSKCVEFINANGSKVMVTDGWNQLVKSRVELVVELYRDIMVKFESK